MHEEKLLSELEKAQPLLSADERLRMWNNIEATLPRPLPLQSIISPYSLYSITTNILKKTMTPVIAILIVVLSGGATVYASDTSRPGDFLYPVDRAVENLELRLASSAETRSLLAESFTEERLHELRDIIDEEVVISPTNIDPLADMTTTNASTTIRDLEIEAHVYVDTTVVKLEMEGKKFYFETTATSTEGVVGAVLGRFPVLSIDQINEVLYLENEDRESRPKDRGLVTISPDGEARINHAIDELLKFLDTASLKDVDKNVVFALLSREVEGVTKPTKVTRVKDSFEIGHENGNLEIKIDDDGNSKIEISDGQNRIKIAQEEGEVTVMTKEQPVVPVVSEEEIEVVIVPEIDFDARAQIFTDQTVVEIVFDKDKIYFATQAETRVDIIADILERFPALTREQVDEELSISLRSRASRPEDLGLDPIPEVVVDPESVPVPVVTGYEDNDDDEYEDEDREDDEDEDREYRDEDEDEDKGEDRDEDEDREGEDEEDEEDHDEN